MIVRQDPHTGAVTVLAPAKLNLYLEVLGRRPDGYHDLESLMVTVDLYDTLEFADAPGGPISLACDDPSLPVDSGNLVVKAAEVLRTEAGRPELGASIRLSKQIPAQAGLGGGSSDAASTLAGLDRLWDLKTPPERLDALAGEIGSDVAFFLHAPAAVCRGRGERVEPWLLGKTLHFVLVCPPVGVSTVSVYRALVPPERLHSIAPFLDALGGDDPGALGRGLFNRLQPFAEASCPSLIPVRDALAELGPYLDGHLMSGSGSAYFGLARDLNAAQDAARRLESLGLGRVRVVTCGP